MHVFDTPTSASVSASGGSGSVGVTAGAGCAWTAAGNVAWITVTPSGGTGTGTVSYSVAANTGTARTGTVTIAGQTFTVNQAGGCTYAISPDERVGFRSGGSRERRRDGRGGLRMDGGGQRRMDHGHAVGGHGHGTVSYSVAANTGTARTGTATIAGRTFTVNQAEGCQLSIAPASVSVSASGGSGYVTVTVGAGCGWTAVSDSAWIGVVSGASGAGNGVVSYSIAPNPGGAMRIGTIAIGSRMFLVTQRPASLPVISSFDPPSVTAGSASFDLTLHGSNFEVGTTVFWNGQERETTFLGVTQLRARIPASDVLNAGKAAVTVVNPSGRGVGREGVRGDGRDEAASGDHVDESEVGAGGECGDQADGDGEGVCVGVDGAVERGGPCDDVRECDAADGGDTGVGAAGGGEGLGGGADACSRGRGVGVAGIRGSGGLVHHGCESESGGAGGWVVQADGVFGQSAGFEGWGGPAGCDVGN